MGKNNNVVFKGDEEMNFKKKLLIFIFLLTFITPIFVSAYSDKVILGGENIGISPKEAKAFIEDPVLGPRLIEICQEVLKSKTSVYDIFDYDSIKVKSCCKLCMENPWLERVGDFSYLKILK